MPATTIRVRCAGPNALAFPPEHLRFEAGRRLVRDDEALGGIVELRAGPGGRVALTVARDEPHRRDPAGYHHHARRQAA